MMVHISLMSFTVKVKELLYVFHVTALKNVSYFYHKLTNSCDHKEGYRKSNANPSAFIIHFVQLVYIGLFLLYEHQ